MTERKMATIRRIDAIDPIVDADAIEVATIGGWKVVVKKDEFKVDDLVVYCEIDSWIPHELAPFLSKGREPREYCGVSGERLRTVKLRGQVSQGLILPAYPTCDNILSLLVEDLDVSLPLNIQKYEAPIAACLAGTVRGNFPSFIPKTDQERIQNLKRNLEKWKEADYTWEVTEKLDGSSCTMYIKDGEFGVCSRNLDLKFDENNTFWKMAIAYNVEQKLKDLNVNVALQGEVIGEGIQGNPYKIKGQQFHVFDVFDIDNFKYLDSDTRKNLVVNLELPMVPVKFLSEKFLCSTTIEDLLLIAEGKSTLNKDVEAEGLVFKCHEDPSVSFKAISNKFLLKSKD